MKYWASRRATTDLPTPPFSPPTRWICVMRGYFSNSASLTVPQLALSHFPCTVLSTVIVLPDEVTTTLILPVICVPPLISKCTSLTDFRSGRLHSSCSVNSLEVLETMVRLHEASSPPPRSIS